jgi:methionine-rich copper-binding protein CopC
MHRSRIVPLATLFLLAFTDAAFAHAHLNRAEPPVDSVVTTVPAEVAINFTEGVEPKFSSIEVQNVQGQRVDKGDAWTTPGDAKRLVTHLTKMAPGTYTVIWHATSVDTHKSEGKYRFTVGP